MVAVVKVVPLWVDNCLCGRIVRGLIICRGLLCVESHPVLQSVVVDTVGREEQRERLGIVRRMCPAVQFKWPVDGCGAHTCSFFSLFFFFGDTGGARQSHRVNTVQYSTLAEKVW